MIYAPLARVISHLRCGDIRVANDIFVSQICRMLSLFRFALYNHSINRSVNAPSYLPLTNISFIISDIAYPRMRIYYLSKPSRLVAKKGTPTDRSGFYVDYKVLFLRFFFAGVFLSAVDNELADLQVSILQRRYVFSSFG